MDERNGEPGYAHYPVCRLQYMGKDMHEAHKELHIEGGSGNAMRTLTSDQDRANKTFTDLADETVSAISV
jgi:hypothetical protein